MLYLTHFRFVRRSLHNTTRHFTCRKASYRRWGQGLRIPRCNDLGRGMPFTKLSCFILDVFSWREAWDYQTERKILDKFHTGDVQGNVISSGSSCLSRFSHTLYTGPNPWEAYHTCSNVLICVVYTILEKKKRKYMWSSFLFNNLTSIHIFHDGKKQAQLCIYITLRWIYRCAVEQYDIQSRYGSCRIREVGQCGPKPPQKICARGVLLKNS